ncbi:mCG1027766 [Mus musculus]|nr:mCG1027766 [Mus musculus]
MLSPYSQSLTSPSLAKMTRSHPSIPLLAGDGCHGDTV